MRNGSIIMMERFSLKVAAALQEAVKHHVIHPLVLHEVVVLLMDIIFEEAPLMLVDFFDTVGHMLPHAVPANMAGQLDMLRAVRDAVRDPANLLNKINATALELETANREDMTVGWVATSDESGLLGKPGRGTPELYTYFLPNIKLEHFIRTDQFGNCFSCTFSLCDLDATASHTVLRHHGCFGVGSYNYVDGGGTPPPVDMKPFIFSPDDLCRILFCLSVELIRHELS